MSKCEIRQFPIPSRACGRGGRSGRLFAAVSLCTLYFVVSQLVRRGTGVKTVKTRAVEFVSHSPTAPNGTRATSAAVRVSRPTRYSHPGTANQDQTAPSLARNVKLTGHPS